MIPSWGKQYFCRHGDCTDCITADYVIFTQSLNYCAQTCLLIFQNNRCFETILSHKLNNNTCTAREYSWGYFMCQMFGCVFDWMIKYLVTHNQWLYFRLNCFRIYQYQLMWYITMLACLCHLLLDMANMVNILFEIGYYFISEFLMSQ